jgi:hypothetical protein
MLGVYAPALSSRLAYLAPWGEAARRLCQAVLFWRMTLPSRDWRGTFTACRSATRPLLNDALHIGIGQSRSVHYRSATAPVARGASRRIRRWSLATDRGHLSTSVVRANVRAGKSPLASSGAVRCRYLGWDAPPQRRSHTPGPPSMQPAISQGETELGHPPDLREIPQTRVRSLGMTGTGSRCPVCPSPTSVMQPPCHVPVDVWQGVVAHGERSAAEPEPFQIDTRPA